MSFFPWNISEWNNLHQPRTGDIDIVAAKIQVPGLSLYCPCPGLLPHCNDDTPLLLLPFFLCQLSSSTILYPIFQYVFKLCVLQPPSIIFKLCLLLLPDIPPSLNILSLRGPSLRIQVGEQEKSEIFFFVLGSMQCIRTIISACKQ